MPRRTRRNFFERDDPPHWWVEWRGVGLYRGRVTYCGHRDFTFYDANHARLVKNLRRVAAEVAAEGCVVSGCFRNGGHV